MSSQDNKSGGLEAILDEVTEAARQAIRDYRDGKEPKPKELTHYEAKAAIAAYVQSEVRRARLDEWERFDKWGEANAKDGQDVISYIKNRMAELEAGNGEAQ